MFLSASASTSPQRFSPARRRPKHPQTIDLLGGYKENEPLRHTHTQTDAHLSLAELALPALARDVAPDASPVHAALEHVERDRRQLGEDHVVRPRDGFPSRLTLEVVPLAASGPKSQRGR